MTLTMTPNETERYRRVKHISVTAQKSCKGPCKMRRSIAQFREGSDICIRCERRAPK